MHVVRGRLQLASNTGDQGGRFGRQAHGVRIAPDQMWIGGPHPVEVSPWIVSPWIVSPWIVSPWIASLRTRGLSSAAAMEGHGG